MLIARRFRGSNWVWAPTADEFALVMARHPTADDCKMDGGRCRFVSQDVPSAMTKMRSASASNSSRSSLTSRTAAPFGGLDDHEGEPVWPVSTSMP